MKVCAQGALLVRSNLTIRDAMGYALSLPGVSTTVIGCETIEQVDENARFAREFVPLGGQQSE